MKRPTLKQVGSESVPLHIALIMDGNRRWAIKQKADNYRAYSQGAETLRSILKAAAQCGVLYMTAFCFSRENWKRPGNELNLLMDLFRFYFKKYGDTLKKENVRFYAMGKRDKLPKDVAAALDKMERDTAENEGINFTVAINYGGKDDILQASRALADKVEKGKMKAEGIDEKTFASHLLSRHLPEPDLLIRTSGEMRLSNFMLWQLAYSELYFSPKLWPEFTPADLRKAIAEFAGRERRYGERLEQKDRKTAVAVAVSR